MNGSSLSSSNLVLGLLLILPLILLVPRSSFAQEVEDEREFDYGERSLKGPSRWGELKAEWAACKNGKLQSPIDMSNARVRLLSRKVDKRHYKPSNATVTNRGHDIMVQWVGNAGSIVINGVEYHLHQAHWHSPSEHTVNGRRYDLELHMVHQTSNHNVKNNIAVFGSFYKIGKSPDAFLSMLMRNISSITDQKGEQRHLEVIDPREIKTESKKFYRYLGSLTVPPCTEGVIWTMNKKVRSVSREQVMLLREAVHDHAERNARPLQPKHGRDLYLYNQDTSV